MKILNFILILFLLTGTLYAKDKSSRKNSFKKSNDEIEKVLTGYIDTVTSKQFLSKQKLLKKNSHQSESEFAGGAMVTFKEFVYNGILMKRYGDKDLLESLEVTKSFPSLKFNPIGLNKSYIIKHLGSPSYEDKDELTYEYGQGAPQSVKFTIEKGIVTKFEHIPYSG